jgi:hypothetical protein
VAALLLVEGGGDLSLEGCSVVSSAAAHCKTSDQLGRPVRLSVPSRARARSPAPGLGC